MDEELEYRVPAKLLTNRDPIILNKLSMREMGQWCFFLFLTYLTFNILPFDFLIKLVLGTIVLMFAALFIHSPINGLAGLEWLYIWLRFRLEKNRHHSQPALETNQAKAVVSVRLVQDNLTSENYVE